MQRSRVRAAGNAPGPLRTDDSAAASVREECAEIPSHLFFPAQQIGGVERGEGSDFAGRRTKGKGTKEAARREER